MNDALDMFPLGPLQPHQSLIEQVLVAVLVMCLIDLAKILGTIVAIVELEYLFGRHNPIEMTKYE